MPMIEWIVSASALILLVLLLRVLIRERVSPRLRYALWGLVLVRLVIPVSLWESPASVLNAAQANESYQLASTLPVSMDVREDGTWRNVAGREDTFQLLEPGIHQQEGLPPLYNAYGWVAVADAEEAQALRNQGQKAVDTAELKQLVDVQNALLKVWQVGVWLAEGFLLLVNLKFYLELRGKRRPDGSYRKLPVYVAEGLPTPCLFGLFRPGIYLTPEVAADETAREHVLAHEYAHFRQGDHAWAIWRGACLALHWYSPLVWLAAVLSRRDSELSCDEGAVRLLGEERRADYGRTLVGLVARRTTPRDLACCATTMTGGKSALKERIALLVKRPRTTAVMAVLVAAACVLFAACTFTGAKAEEDTQGPDVPAEPAQTELAEPAEEPPEEAPGAPEDAVLLEAPENLPTELMDLSRPAEEQGEWLLLAQAPYTDAALYRRADDDGHVYLRLTRCFQVFERDLAGMELLPTMDLFDGAAEFALRVLYPRYEGAYFNGTSYEPGVVAEQVIYIWHEEGKYWTEEQIRTQPSILLTEDLPALAELPTQLVTPGTPEAEADIWLVGEIPEHGVAVYYEPSTRKVWLRYGDAIQAVEGIGVYMPEIILPELYFDDLDGDGDRELIAISLASASRGITQDTLSVYEWSGENWSWTTHRPEGMVEDFNSRRVYQFYDDGSAFISYYDSELLLAPGSFQTELRDGTALDALDVCVLDENLASYLYRGGKLTMLLGGVVRDSRGRYTSYNMFAYVCPVIYTDYGGGQSYLGAWEGVLQSPDAVVQPAFDAEALSAPFRRILERFIGECRELSGERDWSDSLSQNRFALYDIDGDGQEELICELTTTITAGERTTVYNADGTERGSFYPRPVFYDNGVVWEPWSHNQGQACAIWPYFLHRYDARTGRYTRLGEARAISDKVPGFAEVAAADLDGDGMLYYIGDNAFSEENPVDNAVYELWREQYLAGAKILPVRYDNLTADVVRSLGVEPLPDTAVG